MQQSSNNSEEAKYAHFDESTSLAPEFPTKISCEVDENDKKKLAIKQGSNVVYLSLKICERIIPLAKRWKVE